MPSRRGKGKLYVFASVLCDSWTVVHSGRQASVVCYSLLGRRSLRPLVAASRFFCNGYNSLTIVQYKHVCVAVYSGCCQPTYPLPHPITNYPLPSRSTSCHWTAVFRYYCHSALEHTGLPEGQGALGERKIIWEDNIKMELRYIQSQVVDEFIWLKMEYSSGPL
jgi:hypothetical protein